MTIKATTTKAPLKGPFVVVNPRGIPKGRHIFHIGDKRWFEGDVYAGDKAEHLLERGVIRTGLPPVTKPKVVKRNG